MCQKFNTYVAFLSIEIGRFRILEEVGKIAKESGVGEVEERPEIRETVLYGRSS